MSEYFDTLEIRDVPTRGSEKLALLQAQLVHAKTNSTYYAEVFSDIDVEAVKGFGDLALFPITRKSDLLDLQKKNPPFGGLNATPLEGLKNVFISPGPIAEPQGHGDDWWRMGRAAFAAGLRKGDTVLNCFSYHHTPAGQMMETAAKAVGCVVYPGGVGQVEAQIEAIQHFNMDAYMGTPDFLKMILDKAAEIGADISSLKKAMVSGGALFPSLREEYESRGIAVYQCLGTADLGLIAYETPSKHGMILDEDVLVEFVTPGTGDPVPDGEVGELIVTLLTNTDYPLIRFATGDLSAFMSTKSPCGRTSRCIKGWMGRADQKAKVKGMFVDPAQVDRVVKSHDEILKARIVITLVDNKDVMTLKVETSAEATAGLVTAIEASIRTELKLRGSVECVAVGSLPTDGIVIDDQRKYD